MAGAIATFVGTTRNNFNGKQVTTLEYEAYEPLAIKELWYSLMLLDYQNATASARCLYTQLTGCVCAPLHDAQGSVCRCACQMERRQDRYLPQAYVAVLQFPHCVSSHLRHRFVPRCRLGVVAVGKASVAIAISSVHR